MCYSRCPYEDYWGECRWQNALRRKPFPLDAHCVEDEEIDMEAEDDYFDPYEGEVY